MAKARGKSVSACVGVMNPSVGNEVALKTAVHSLAQIFFNFFLHAGLPSIGATVVADVKFTYTVVVSVAFTALTDEWLWSLLLGFTWQREHKGFCERKASYMAEGLIGAGSIF